MEAPIDSRQLKAFVLLAKTGSYSETGKHLFLTQSAVSHAMRTLEGDLGCRLLARLGRRMTLTEAGEALFHHAQSILKEMERARTALTSLNKWGFQRLRLGAETAFCRQMLLPVFVRLQKEYPHLLLRIESLDGTEARALLERNSADIVLGDKPRRDDRFEFVPLGESRLHVVVAPSHPWAAKGQVVRADIARQGFILGSGANNLRKLTEDYFAEDQIVLNVVGEIDSAAMIKEFVQQGLGATVLPAWGIRDELTDGSLVALSPGPRRLTQTWGLTHWRGRTLSPLESALVNFCKDTAAEVG